MRTIIHIHILPHKLGHFWRTHPDLTNFPSRASWLGRLGSHPVPLGVAWYHDTRLWGVGPATPAKANTWQEHLVRPSGSWRVPGAPVATLSSAASGAVAGRGAQRPRAAERCPRTHPPVVLSGRGHHCMPRATGGQQRGGADALTSTLPVPRSLARRPHPWGARTGSPHPGQPWCLPPSALCQTFQP